MVRKLFPVNFGKVYGKKSTGKVYEIIFYGRERYFPVNFGIFPALNGILSNPIALRLPPVLFCCSVIVSHG